MSDDPVALFPLRLGKLQPMSFTQPVLKLPEKHIKGMPVGIAAFIEHVIPPAGVAVFVAHNFLIVPFNEPTEVFKMIGLTADAEGITHAKKLIP